MKLKYLKIIVRVGIFSTGMIYIYIFLKLFFILNNSFFFFGPKLLNYILEAHNTTPF